MKQQPLRAYLTRLIWLSILPLVFLSIWLAWESVRDREQDLRKKAHHLAHNVSSAIEQTLDSHIRALSLLADSPLAGNPDRWPELYAEAQAFRERFESHVIFADTGDPMRMHFHTRLPFGEELPPVPRPEGRAAAPQALATGQPAVGDSFAGPIAEETLVAIAVPGGRGEQIEHLLPQRIYLAYWQMSQKWQARQIPSITWETLKHGDTTPGTAGSLMSRSTLTRCSMTASQQSWYLPTI
ncbi:hypothetical protein QPM17_21275 [Marinobacter sp. TBZ242]|uniref:Uncharacterized protein n=1 Tax=Marinobacter azerbaijanicus TaxID=3050455 RepID=A0ABT7IJ23_9GAMM|nr:hypothetical protein [Marinobacter sp. TBZ242]MDL0433680.1 hypothetical protein [Marinobacter sp. TBZ242]